MNSTSSSLTLPTPATFPAFPYNPPYEIQVELMRHLYQVIEDRKVSVVESPTGTGKTLSLLCASLTWLQDEKDRARRGKLRSSGGKADDDPTDWVTQQTLARQRRDLEAEERDYAERLERARQRERERRRKDGGRVVKKPKLSKQENHEDEDESFLPEADNPGGGDSEDAELNLSPEVRELMARLNPTSTSHLNADEEPTLTKIFYASRTHSQLTQVLPELGRLNIPVTVDTTYVDPTTNSKDATQARGSDAGGTPQVSIHALGKRPASSMDETAVSVQQQDQTQHQHQRRWYTPTALSLGSRKHLCINDELRARGGDLDEACRELLGEKKVNRCPYLPPMNDPAGEVKMGEFRDEILSIPKDIEDLALSGRRAGLCPYFGARRGVKGAELITLPYNLLLQKSAREALGIDLRGQVVVVDEAHNLISTLLALSTTVLSLRTLNTSLHQITTYITRFRTRLSPANLVQLRKLKVFLDGLAAFVGEWRDVRIGKGSVGATTTTTTSGEKTPSTKARAPAPTAPMAVTSKMNAKGSGSRADKVNGTTSANAQEKKGGVHAQNGTGLSAAGAAEGKLEKTEVLTPSDLLERLGRRIVGLNLLEIEGYLRRSKIARKISGYADKEAERAEAKAMAEAGNSKSKFTSSSSRRKGQVPPLHAVEDLMRNLAGATDDGRITLALIPPSCAGAVASVEIKYHQLNPAPAFKEVVDEARAVIMAGGTMSPISDIQTQLLTYLPLTRFTSFSCGHIIPSSNVLTMAVTRGPVGGPKGEVLELKAGRKGDEGAITELATILLNFTHLVPGGMIVFFPSYSFLNAAKERWKAGGWLDKFGKKKKVFFEPEDQASVEGVLTQYAAAVRTTSTATPSNSLHQGLKGALLLAVIGAKLSEGLNFKDDLARAVIIVGLPFANLGSAELKERMRYVKRLEDKMIKEGREGNQKGQNGRKTSIERAPGAKDAAAELYENMCMNAVNQSIGRAIRHANDWAALILLDSRYAAPSIQKKLPKWLGKDMKVAQSFGSVVKEMGVFYRGKRE